MIPKNVIGAMLLVFLALQTGCALYNYHAPPTRLHADPRHPALAKALDYLEATQVREPVRPLAGGGDWPGNWPQYARFPSSRHRIREVSPFIPTFIHGSLGRIEQAALRGEGGLGPPDFDRARSMRARAAAFMGRFDASRSGGTAGAYAFWPSSSDSRAGRRRLLSAIRGDWLLKALGLAFLGGPRHHGTFMPLNAPQMPRRFALAPDADTTSVVWVALMDEARANLAPPPEPSYALFATWRELGQQPLRLPTRWLERPSGVYLTYFGGADNDVDLVVNANVVYMLARFGRLDLPGAAEAIAVLNRQAERLTYERPNDPAAPYYPVGFAPHYCVSRAYADGPAPALRPAAELLARDIERSARRAPDGTARWDRGSPDLDTALAVLTLRNCGRAPELARAGVRYLMRTQNPATGAWKEGFFFGGRTDTGLLLGWYSPALTTAFAMEAILSAPPESRYPDVPCRILDPFAEPRHR